MTLDDTVRPLPVTRGEPLDPPAALDALRESEPVSRLRYPDGHVGWLVTGHQQARAVLADPRFSADSRHKRVPVVRHGADPYMGAPALPGWFVDMDAPEHTRFRRALAGSFTVRRIRELRPVVEQIVDEHLDRMRALGPPTDLVAALALPVPTRVICALLGVPYADHESFERHSAALFSLESSRADAEEAMAALEAHLLAIVAEKRARPADDVLSTLLGQGFGDAEVAGAGVLLLTAGHETVAGTTSLAVYATATRLRDRVRTGVGPGLVEELMRYLSIFQFGVPRSPTEDVELDGLVLERGSSVTVSLPAANRDPDRFPDPHRLDPDRDARGHLAFGFGPHQCIGQNLARLEVEVILDRLWRAFPGLEVAVPTEELRFHHDVGFYGLHRLPVVWS